MRKGRNVEAINRKIRIVSLPSLLILNEGNLFPCCVPLFLGTLLYSHLSYSFRSQSVNEFYEGTKAENEI